MRALLAIGCFAACSSSSPPVDQARLGGLVYVVPASWTSRDLSTHQRAMVEWTPRDNDRKESVVVTRIERPALAKSKPVRLENLLLDAQQSLPRVKHGVPVRLATSAGLTGVRIEGEFVPRGQAEPYTRIHAVLVEGTSLVHVIYTARSADREAFEIVVDSLRRGA